MTVQNSNEVKDSMAAFSEQFQKATVAVTEQARQTMNAAREQIQQNRIEAQQVQGDLARMIMRLGEQNSKLLNAAVDSFWDASLSMLKVVTWGQERTERALLQGIEQSRQAREEGAALVGETVRQAQRQQSELYRLAQESLRASLFSPDETGPREGKAAR